MKKRNTDKKPAWAKKTTKKPETKTSSDEIVEDKNNLSDKVVEEVVEVEISSPEPTNSDTADKTPAETTVKEENDLKENLCEINVEAVANITKEVEFFLKHGRQYKPFPKYNMGNGVIYDPDAAPVTVEVQPKEGELFGQQITVEGLDANWTGWEAICGMSFHRVVRRSGYFAAMIKAGRYASVEDAIKDANDVSMEIMTFENLAREGGELENAFIYVYGISSKDFKEEEIEERFNLMVMIFAFGAAQHDHNLKKALGKLAKDGNLDALKTLLTNSGFLSPEGGNSGSGVLAFILDSDDLEA
tara:strand:+ start:177 stop:1082 length:906 start_codon:yes stop_codon:yes gene_type:complete